MKHNFKRAYLYRYLCFALLSVFSISVYAQQLTVNGTVKDVSEEPIIGASVLVKGTGNGAITDLDGNFTLSNVPLGATIEVSFIGYQAQAKRVSDAEPLLFTLAEDTKLLDEVVVVGYGVQKKSDLTGSVSQVKGESIASYATNNVTQALQGTTAGMTVFMSSGAPTAQSTIRIRGISSNSNSDPLVIIDGMAGSLDDVDSQSIESIEILKDAASASIYGAQAGNGVILVTTKSGKKNEARLFYNAQYSMQKLAKKCDLMNADEYAKYMVAAGALTQSYIDQYWDGTTDTDWMDVAFGTGVINRHTIGAQGGGEKGTYYLSAGFYNNDGMFKGDKDYLKRINAQLNATYQVKKWLKIQTNNSFVHNYTKSLGEGSRDGSTLSQVTQMDPLTPVVLKPNELTATMKNLLESGYTLLKDKNENYYSLSDFNNTGASNPFIRRDITDAYNKSYQIHGNTEFIITPIKNFVFTSRIGYNFGVTEHYSHSQPYYYSAQNYSKNHSLTMNTTSWHKLQWENFVNYSQSWGKHNMTGMAGMSMVRNQTFSSGGTTNKLTDNKDNYLFLDYSADDADDSVSGMITPNRQLSYFGRLTYAYDNRYALQFNFRADAFDTSVLSKDARWGYFPSASVGWTVSNENFFKENVNKSIFTYLKFRASYGTNGSVSGLTNFLYASSLSLSNYYAANDKETPIVTASPSTILANPNLKWETSVQLDLGVDARFFNDRLTFTMDYFNKNTRDLLITTKPPFSTGASSVKVNAGKVNNHGWEFELGWKENRGDWSYNINANLATLKNEVVSLDGYSRIAGLGSRATIPYTYFEEGNPAWYYNGYKFDHFDEEGHAVYQDTNKDGSFTSDDATYIGDPYPAFTYGINLGATYKNFDISLTATGACDFEIYYAGVTLDRPSTNRLAHFYNDSYWAKGDKARYPVHSNGDPYMFCSDLVLYKGDFLKIKQLQVGYTFRSANLKKIALSSVRVYASIDNLATFTSYPGMDPEVAMRSSSSNGIDYGNYPLSRQFTVGVNINF